MAGNTTANTDALIRSELWMDELEEILHEQLLGINIVRTVDFPDGSLLTMPSVGTPTTRTRAEGAPAVYDALDTGEIAIVLREEIIVANKISKKLRQDSRWIDNVGSMLPSEQAIAIMERYETDILALGNNQFGGTANANTINGGDHRFIGNGTNETIAVNDFAAVGFSMKKAKVSRNGLIGIVDPSVGYAIETLTNISNVSNNPRFEGIIETGISPNMRFVRNVFGIDIFESNLLATANETLGGKTTTQGVANLFMNIGNAKTLPFTVAWKEQPTSSSMIDFDTDDLKFKTTARWGNGLTKDENLVVVITDTDQVTF